MSVYDKRYHVSKDMVSHYTDDPREALRLLDQGLAAVDEDYPKPYVDEGYGEYRDTADPEITQVTRRTTRRLTRQNLVVLAAERDYSDQRLRVARMIVDLRGVAA